MSSTSHTRSLALRGSAASAALALVAGLTVVGSATADPDTADAALKQYEKLSEQASGTNEAAKAAQEEAEKATAAKRAADATLVAAKREVAAVKARQAALQPQIDAVVVANYKGSRTNRTYALLVSDSPQQMLDQMSTLDFINRDVVATVDAYKKSKAAADSAATRAAEAATAAENTRTDAERKATDLKQKKSRLAQEVARIKAIYDRLTGAQRQSLIGPPTPFDPSKVPPGSTSELVRRARRADPRRNALRLGRHGPRPVRLLGPDGVGLPAVRQVAAAHLAGAAERRPPPSPEASCSRATSSSTTRPPRTSACTSATERSCTPPRSASRCRSCRSTPRGRTTRRCASS